jgi:hypothetical protein
MPRSLKDTYTGHSGQNAVKAELLHRLCNVAVPEVDVGEDVLAFRDGDEAVLRLQVKTANARRLKTEAGYTAQFSVPLGHLRRRDKPPLYYVFAVRLEDTWSDFLIVRRTALDDLRVLEGFGTPNEGALKFTLSFRSDDVRCGGISLQAYRNAWETLPPLGPAATGGGSAEG